MDGTRTPIGDETQLAKDLFNGTWELLESKDRSAADDERMVHMAHASRYHWGPVGTPMNLAIGEWQISRVYAVLGRSEPALHHARQVVDVCRANGLGDFHLAYGYEALARGNALAGNADEARNWTEQALAACADITDPETRTVLLSDLETIPAQAGSGEPVSETFVLPNVYGLIKRPDESSVLVQRRWKPQTDPDNLGKWELPGGKWRVGETAQECLRRELQEEAGISLSSAEGRFVQHEHFGQRIETSSPTLIVKGLISVLVVYTAYSDEEPIAEGDETRDATFMAKSELKNALRQHPESFTATSFAALTELVARDLL